MPRQMIFEQFMERPSEAGAETLRRMPREERSKLVGLLAELMGRTTVPKHGPPPTDEQLQTLPIRKEVADHE